ncbi:MAG: DUF5009 domain-containing protein [Planctomycetales bacterium]|nr:DUF5009 domain-containing protein [Planctomycetales bacterium]
MSDTERSEYSTRRVAAIDALRGFDMFWIIGGDALALAILANIPTGWSSSLSSQLEHVAWEGFRFYDLIFPMFLFLVGCAMPFSLGKYRDRPARVYWRIARRVAALIALGLLSAGLMKFDWENLRLAGVLQRIGICYALGAIIYLHTRWQGQVVATTMILFAYWALLEFVPTPGGVAGDLSMEGNLAGWLDRNYLPGKILQQYYGFGDNEGILSTIPAIATVLLGALTGSWLKSDRTAWKKLSGLVLAGAIFLFFGYAWGFVFPVIKNLWTSSFVLVSAGWSLLLLAFFYLILDMAGFTRWTTVFTVIGMNAITIYFAQRFIDFDHMSEFFLAGPARLMGIWGIPLLLAGSLAAKLMLLWFLYAKRVFLRV